MYIKALTTFQGSLRYEFYSITKPIAMILRTISILKMIRYVRSRASINGSGSSKLGSSMAKVMQFAKIVSKINLSNQTLNTISMTVLRKRLVVVQPHNELLA